jgi:hypothetical protein
MDFVTLFENATVAGIPLLIFVLALVQWVKSFTAGNRWYWNSLVTTQKPRQWLSGWFLVSVIN